MTDEKLCLKWNDFQDFVQASFAELRNDIDFTDVTLACEDQGIKVHKAILATSSPFFKSCDLTAIVDFIYLGEANIFQDQLESFLALAQELELKGLSGSSDEKVPEYPGESFARTDLNKKQKIHEGTVSNVKYESNTFERTVMRIQPKLKETPKIDSDTMEKIEMMIEKRGADEYSCTKCGHISKHLGHMKMHVEKHIEGLEYPCNSCNKVFRSSNSSRAHKSRCVFKSMD